MNKKVYIETYGCQMNVADSEVVVSILKGAGYEPTENIKDAGLILINTCSIRDNAEQRIWGRLKAISHLKKNKNDLKKECKQKYRYECRALVVLSHESFLRLMIQK